MNSTQSTTQQQKKWRCWFSVEITRFECGFRFGFSFEWFELSEEVIFRGMSEKDLFWNSNGGVFNYLRKLAENYVYWKHRQSLLRMAICLWLMNASLHLSSGKSWLNSGYGNVCKKFRKSLSADNVERLPFQREINFPNWLTSTV